MTFKPALLSKTDLVNKTKACVRCGICIPYCPTYSLKLDERYSPRGRIMIMQSLAKSEINLLEADEYLSSCLNCLICESVCPAKVDYQSLIDSFHQEKNQLAKKKSNYFISFFIHPFGNRFLLILARLGKLLQLHLLSGFLKPSFIKIAFASLNLVQYAKLKRVKRKSMFFDNTNEFNQPKKIVLFSGCTSHLFEQNQIKACELIFNRLGVEVEKMNSMRCCGALSYHQGNQQKSKKLIADLEGQFKNHTPLLLHSSGCLSYLKTHSNLNSEAVLDYCLREIKQQKKIFKRWKFGKVLIHLPCTQRYPLSLDGMFAWIKSIEDLNARFIDWGCCGSAGSYIISHPEESKLLFNQLIGEVENKFQMSIKDFDYLVTSNIGCILQFNQALALNQKIKIIHPVELMAMIDFDESDSSSIL